MADPAADDRAPPESVVVARVIRDAALQVPGIVAMSPGRQYVEATYGAGITILGVGVSLQQGQIETDVHVVVDVTPLPVLARRVRHSIETALRRTGLLAIDQINIYIDDIVFPGREDAEMMHP